MIESKKVWVVYRDYHLLPYVFGFKESAEVYRAHCAAWVTRNVDVIRTRYRDFKPKHDPGLNCRG